MFIIITILSVAAALIQTVLVPINLEIMLLIASADYLKKENWPIAAFLFGLIYDITSGKLLGKTPIAFIVIILAYWLYRRKWNSSHPMFLLIFGIFADMLCRIIWGLPISLVTSLPVGIFGILWGWLQRGMKRDGLQLNI